MSASSIDVDTPTGRAPTGNAANKPPQKVIDEFWASFTTKHPGKGAALSCQLSLPTNMNVMAMLTMNACRRLKRQR